MKTHLHDALIASLAWEAVFPAGPTHRRPNDPVPTWPTHSTWGLPARGTDSPQEVAWDLAVTYLADHIREHEPEVKDPVHEAETRTRNTFRGLRYHLNILHARMTKVCGSNHEPASAWIGVLADEMHTALVLGDVMSIGELVDIVVQTHPSDCGTLTADVIMAHVPDRVRNA